MKHLIAALLLLAAGAFAQPLPNNNQGMHIQRPAAVDDAANGGLRITRDARLVGGTPGFVNAGLYTYTLVGPDNRAFEWNGLFIMDNYSRNGENTGAYFQGNKFSTGPTWGSVSEVADFVGAGGPAVGKEIDNWTTGPDNGMRLGLDIVVGDARTIRGLPGGGVAQATIGMRIGATSVSPWSRWTNGVVLMDYTNAGIVLQGNSTRGIWLQGEHIVALDLSSTIGQTAVRLKAGQQVCFDDWDQYCVRQDGGTHELSFTNAGNPLMRLTPGGHLYLKGQVWPNQP